VIVWFFWHQLSNIQVGEFLGFEATLDSGKRCETRKDWGKEPAQYPTQGVSPYGITLIAGWWFGTVFGFP